MSEVVAIEELKPKGSESPYLLLCQYAAAARTVNKLYEDDDSSPLYRYLAFESAGAHFLLPVTSVRSVIRDVQSVTRLPFTPEWFLGLTSIRGEIVSLVSMASIWLEKPPTRKREHLYQHYILLSQEGTGFLLKVDAIFGMSNLEVKEIGGVDDFIDGVVVDDGKRWQRIHLPTLVEKRLLKTA